MAQVIRGVDGYLLEARIPWRPLGREKIPSANTVVALCVLATDGVREQASARTLSGCPYWTGGRAAPRVLADDDPVARRVGAPTMAGHVYALLVGIDAYTGVVPPLVGCVNDVTAFSEILKGRVPADDLTMVVVTDEDATRDDRHDRVRLSPGQAGADDVALFYYSGHGAHQEAPQEFWDFEPDHQNETLVLVDSREPGGWDLADKELAVLIAAGRRERLPPARRARLLPLRRRDPRPRRRSCARPRRTCATVRSRPSWPARSSRPRLRPPPPRQAPPPATSTRPPASGGRRPPAGTCCSRPAAPRRRPRRSGRRGSTGAPCRPRSRRRSGSPRASRPTATSSSWSPRR